MNNTVSTTIPGTPAAIANFNSGADIIELERRLLQLEEDFDKLKWFVLDNMRNHSGRIG